MFSMLFNKDREKTFVSDRHTLTQTDRRHTHTHTEKQMPQTAFRQVEFQTDADRRGMTWEL